MAQMTQPLAESGYYVLPVSLVDETLKGNGMSTPGVGWRHCARGRWSVLVSKVPYAEMAAAAPELRVQRQ